ncbi:uncharacterized protein N7515_001455 [Penicillium bovifimosum]|uniref:Fatty acyl-CoA reductase n=1 Tax=Penicillium bovifimosum TaxID=126998 RepID=A0A9W9L895_9EURO|nr:uncharacterized protein N7515_001455 [Penicillium bovifimosum]KAJ5142668.1 hypothetical protein N7515_001455 [Penicillium bovifimosum]
MTHSTDPVPWFTDQVVFLTGATGNLGGCLMYKLALKLPTAKIYVLCRGSIRRAMEKWEDSMPEQIEEILDSGKIRCLTGDITHPNMGLGESELEILQNEVTVVIHCAATFSLFQPLPESIRDNSVPVIELSRMLLSFRKIKILLHISTISSRSFLPGGTILENAEKISPSEDSPERQLLEISSTGRSQYTDRFIAPYGQSKYLAEQFLLESTLPFPVLIVRPSNIGPAVQDPYPLYGPEGAIPLHTFMQLLFEANETRTMEQLGATIPRHLLIEEIPVDLVANTCLLHLASGSVGVVHAGSELYVPITFGECVDRIRLHAPRSLMERAGRVRVKMHSHFAEKTADMLEHLCRDWRLDCQRSRRFTTAKGPIGLDISEHDFDSFFRVRILQRARNMTSWIDSFDPM